MRALLTDFGFLYQFWATKGDVDKELKSQYLDKSIDFFDQASKLDPAIDRIYFNWAISLYFKKDLRRRLEKSRRSREARREIDRTEVHKRSHKENAAPGKRQLKLSLLSNKDDPASTFCAKPE
jgi:hypothetical protein